jgi:hypothetical protein
MRAETLRRWKRGGGASSRRWVACISLSRLTSWCDSRSSRLSHSHGQEKSLKRLEGFGSDGRESWSGHDSIAVV